MVWLCVGKQLECGNPALTHLFINWKPFSQMVLAWLCLEEGTLNPKAASLTSKLGTAVLRAYF